ncbi:MAG TPA: hypothetical protein ENJ30_03265 [Desulfobulbaceae bacterium]|nr:hypothetical protein [Desulfobulbaceae bacterium]
MGQEWIPVKRQAKEGSASVKKVRKSGIRDLRGRALDQVRRGVTLITYETGGVWKGTFEHDQITYDTLAVPKAATISEEGVPEIPQEGLYVAVPEGASNVSVKIIDKKMHPMPGTWKLRPAPKPITEEEYIAGKEEYLPKSELYESDDEYPGRDFDFLGLKVLDGVMVAHLIVYLAQYKPLSGSLSVVEKMTIEIGYDVPPQTDRAVKKQIIRPLVGDMILDFEHVLDKEREIDLLDSEEGGEDQPPESAGWMGSDGLTLDPEMTRRPPVPYEPFTPVEPLPHFSAIALLKRKNIVCEYVIVTPNSLRQSVGPLLQAKSGWPHYAMVAATETISAEFPATSLKKSIKDFLSWAWDNWRCPPRYVVLAGDSDTIPVHLWSVGGHTYASDHYYADIHGSLAPEIVISRIPTSNATTMRQVCQRLAGYENLRGPDWGGWQNEVVLVAYQATTYKQCSDSIATTISPRFRVTKRYGDSSTRKQVVDKMNSGVLVANYRGHGSKTAWSSNNGLRTRDISGLNNQSRPPMVFCIACQNAWIDDPNTETVVETFLREGKAVAVLGATRSSPTYANNDFDKYLFQGVMEGEISPGRIVQRAKTLMVLNHGNSSTHQQDVVMYMLFGDPTAKVTSDVEFLRGTWDMDHDGWKGRLDITLIRQHRVEKSGNCGYPVWSFSGTYTRAGKKYSMKGKIGGRDSNNRNPGCKRSDHKVEFTIDFASNNQQKFVGYITTWTRNVMAGYTWWSKRPFGWHAKKH